MTHSGAWIIPHKAAIPNTTHWWLEASLVKKSDDRVSALLSSVSSLLAVGTRYEARTTYIYTTVLRCPSQCQSSLFESLIEPTTKDLEPDLFRREAHRKFQGPSPSHFFSRNSWIDMTDCTGMEMHFISRRTRTANCSEYVEGLLHSLPYFVTSQPSKMNEYHLADMLWTLYSLSLARARVFTTLHCTALLFMLMFTVTSVVY